MTKIRKKSAVKPDVRTPSGTDQQIDESRSGKHINHEKSSGQSGSHGCPCVYILECKDGTLYTGWTNDLKKRFAAPVDAYCGRNFANAAAAAAIIPLSGILSNIR